ncbi:MAG: hypothetical protein AAFN77_08625 [Planctomycetota bacterium]
MTKSSNETAALDALNTLLEGYRAMDQLIDSIASQNDQPSELFQELKKLETKKLEIEKFESETREARSQFEQQGKPMTPAMKQVFDQATNLLTSMLEKVEALESSMKASQGKLIPEINQSVRATQMQNAYGGSD